MLSLWNLQAVWEQAKPYFKLLAKNMLTPSEHTTEFEGSAKNIQQAK